MVDDNNLDKDLGNIKQIIASKKFDDTKTLIEADDRLPDDTTLKNVDISYTCYNR